MYVTWSAVFLLGAESDLETVKKATPLYGLPSWWGDKDTEDLPQDDPNGKTKTR